MSRELLFAVTEADCRFDYYRGSGKGGQKRNKTSSAVRCTHVASGAVGQSDDTRSQHANKQIAFRRMAESEKFRAWHRVEMAKRLGHEKAAQIETDRQMRRSNLKIEGKDERGLWTELED